MTEARSGARACLCVSNDLWEPDASTEDCRQSVVKNYPIEAKYDYDRSESEYELKFRKFRLLFFFVSAVFLSFELHHHGLSQVNAGHCT